MKYLALLLALLTLPFVVFAQEYDEEEVTYQTSKDKKEEFKPFYQRPGSVIINVSNYMALRGRSTTLPVNIHLDITPGRNFTVGPIFTYLQFKSQYQQEIDQIVYTNSGVKYHQYVVGLKGSYHLMPLFERLFNKTLKKQLLDVYISGWGGYSYVRSNAAEAEQEVIQANQDWRGGVSLGARSMILKRFGFFVEAGYSSYAFGTFGLSFLVTKP